jgi:hypothetical protein
VPTVNLIDPHTHVYLPLEQLRVTFSATGVLKRERIITDCGGGAAACSDAFILTLLGASPQGSGKKRPMSPFMTARFMSGRQTPICPCRLSTLTHKLTRRVVWMELSKVYAAHQAYFQTKMGRP